MKKILVIITTEFLYYGGLTTVMINYYKALSRTDLQIDFASTNTPCDKDSAFKYIKVNSSNYYCLGNRKKNLLAYLDNLKTLLIENKYDVIHVNGNSATMVFELQLAKLLGVKTRIAHGHTTRSNHPVVHALLKKYLSISATHRIAVSQAVGEWLYDRDFMVLNNAIDTQKYLFNEDVRIRYRNEYHLNDCIVIGNVGKLYPPKNHRFLLEVFSYICEKSVNYRLVLAGGGELEKELKNYAKELGISSKVIFLGMREDINNILQSFDIFVFPSIYEGLGLALIEAQASGLMCVASNMVPIETHLTENIEYYNLNEGPAVWASKIMNISINDRKEKSEKAELSIRNKGYDIKTEAHKLDNIYRNEK